MNNDLLFDGKTYISVSRASKKLGYAADYIGQLCRAGKIDARMIGRTWYVEWESIKKHKKSKSNRIRRTAEEIRQERQTQDLEKLNVTAGTDGEVDEDCPDEDYLDKIDLEVENSKKPEEELVEPILVSLHDQQNEESLAGETDRDNPFGIKYIPTEQISTPSVSSENIWLPRLSKSKERSAVNLSQKERFTIDPILFGAVTLVIFFVSMNLIFVSGNFPSTGISMENRTIDLVSNIENITRPDVNNNQRADSQSYVETDTGNLSAAYANIATVFNYFTEELRKKINRWAVGYLRSLGFVPQVKQPESTQKHGLVIVSDPNDHDVTVASIKNSFSDEVIVVEDLEGGSGVITPIFKNIEGDPYTYVLVPLESP